MPTPLIEASDLAAVARLQLLDATPRALTGSSPRHYGRISVLPLPMSDWIPDSLGCETGFDRSAYWLAALADAGIEVSAGLVVFDDGRMTEAARIWFLLQHLGLHCRVLNGGSPALLTLHQALDGHRRPPLPPGAPSAGNTAQVNWVDRAALQADLAAGRIQVLDCRTADEWSGANRRDNPRAGHLPGSCLLPHTDLLNGNRLKPPGTLRRLLEDAGLDPRRGAIISLCNGGGRAALAALAAVHAGFDPVRLYYRGFADWARDPDCPLVQGMSSTGYSGPSGSDGCRR